MASEGEEKSGILNAVSELCEAKEKEKKEASEDAAASSGDSLEGNVNAVKEEGISDDISQIMNEEETPKLLSPETSLNSDDVIGEQLASSSSSSLTRYFQQKKFESGSSLEEEQNTATGAETPRTGRNFGSAAGEVVPFQSSSDSMSRNIINSKPGAMSNKVYEDIITRRADIFRPIISDDERKMLGISNIPMFPNGQYSFDRSESSASLSLSKISMISRSHGGGDADMRDTTSLFSSDESTGSRITSEGDEKDSSLLRSALKKPGVKKKGKECHVRFSDYDGQPKAKGKRRDSEKSETSADKDVAIVSPPEEAGSSVAEKDGNQFFSKTDTFSRYVRSLSVQTLKSKKLETKLQQDMRVAFFDLEAQRASEDWKFRKSVEALDLEYRKKLLNLVENHNTFQNRLQERFMKQIHKTERRLKKEALEGRLNEGNCFNVSQSINKFITKI